MAEERSLSRTASITLVRRKQFGPRRFFSSFFFLSFLLSFFLSFFHNASAGALSAAAALRWWGSEAVGPWRGWTLSFLELNTGLSLDLLVSLVILNEGVLLAASGC